MITIVMAIFCFFAAIYVFFSPILSWVVKIIFGGAMAWFAISMISPFLTKNSNKNQATEVTLKSENEEEIKQAKVESYVRGGMGVQDAQCLIRGKNYCK
jgi:phosphate/sulfate permease